MRKILSILGLAGMVAAGLHAAEGSKNAGGVAPDDAQHMLTAGNERFARGLVVRPHVDAEHRRELTHGQRPWAVVVSGSDSRVSPEIIFDQGLGDLYVLRNAGNVVKSEVELGSIEYAVEKLGARLVVVLGSTQSEVVRDALASSKRNDQDSMGDLAKDMEPAMDEAKDRVYGLKDPLLSEAVEKNVLHAMKQLLKHSPLIAAKVKAGDVKVVGGIYNLENSRVTWLGEHPSQSEIIEGKKP